MAPPATTGRSGRGLSRHRSDDRKHEDVPPPPSPVSLNPGRRPGRSRAATAIGPTGAIMARITARRPHRLMTTWTDTVGALSR
jgi:hypothetical protein